MLHQIENVGKPPVYKGFGVLERSNLLRFSPHFLGLITTVGDHENLSFIEQKPPP
jgi:hypothetical protein